MSTRTSISNGAWDSAGTWDTGIPVDGDEAVIEHNVYIDSDVTVGAGTSGATYYAITINNGGVLRWANPPSGNWTLTLHGGIIVKEGGAFQVGTQASPIPASHTATVYFDITSSGTYWRLYAEDGVIDIHGASAYHMASASMQRAKLDGNISAGSDVSFTLDRDADWEVGDWIAIGCGADKDTQPSTATYRPERVQIKTKTDSKNYTADFSYLHRSGDHIVMLERNVIFKSNSGENYGFRIVGEVTSSTSFPITTRMRITWAKMRYGGAATTTAYSNIYWYDREGSHTEFYPSGALLLKNIAFDTSGGEIGGSFPDEYYEATAVRISANTGFAEVDCVEDLYAYAYGRLIYVEDAEEMEFTRLVIVHLYQEVILTEGADAKRVEVDDVWASGNVGSYGGGFFEGAIASVSNVELFNHDSGFMAVYDPGDVVKSNWNTIRNVKMYHMDSYGIYSSNTASTWNVLLENVEFYNCGSAALRMYSNPRINIRARNCSFDKCNYNYTSYGAIELGGSYWFDCLFENCTFGTISRNNGLNVRFNRSGDIDLRDAVGRFRAEGCTFVEPTNWSGMVEQTYYNKTWLWSIFHDDSTQWSVRSARSHLSFELADCEVQDSVGADQLHTDYPAGVTHLLQGHAGGEMHDEPTVTIDGTFAQRILPFFSGFSYVANGHNPIPIPVAAGQVVTVKMSMRKTKDGVLGVPGIRLEGPGIYEESHMTRGLLDTWEELTVSATANATGTAYLFVIGGTNNSYNNQDGGNCPVLGPPAVTGGDWMTMFDCVVYADKLSISIS